MRDINNEWKLIEWKGQSRKGLWDMGHKPGEEYRRLRRRYLTGVISKKQFLLEYRKEGNFVVQDSLRNQSHIDELVDEDGDW